MDLWVFRLLCGFFWSARFDKGYPSASLCTKWAKEDVVLRPHQAPFGFSMGSPRLSGSSLIMDWFITLLLGHLTNDAEALIQFFLPSKGWVTDFS